MGTPYTTSAAVSTRMSAIGLTLRTADDAAAVPQAISDASTEIDGYCLLGYSANSLAASAWVEKKTRDLAVFHVCGRKMNPIPQTVQVMYEQALKDLEQVRGGSIKIPDAAERKQSVPVISNLHVRQTRVPHTDVEMGRSTGTPEGYTQFVDPVEQFFDYNL